MVTELQRVPSVSTHADGMSPLWLPIVAVLETLSLIVLLANLATADNRGLAAGLGPLHGTLYLLAITLTFVQHASTRARVLSFIPAVGAPLAAWQVRRDERR